MNLSNTKINLVFAAFHVTKKPIYFMLTKATFSHSLSSLRHSPRTASEMQLSLGELTVSKNMFIVPTKLLCSPFFKLLNFSWTSTSPMTYICTHTFSQRADTYSTAIYFFFYTCAHTHTHTYAWLGHFFYSFVLMANTHTHIWATRTPICISFVIYIPTQIHIQTLLLCINFSLLVLL